MSFKNVKPSRSPQMFFLRMSNLVGGLKCIFLRIPGGPNCLFENTEVSRVREM